MVKKPPYQKRNGANVGILCPSLTLTLPVLAVESSAKGKTPVRREQKSISVQLALRFQRNSGHTYVKTLQRDLHIAITLALMMTI